MQPPQFFGSAVTSVQAPLHRVVPGAQPQTPLTHDAPAAQVVPQPPQFAGSFCRSTHRPLHSVWPDGQLHTPLVQD